MNILSNKQISHYEQQMMIEDSNSYS